jgi:hypothetical protein
MFVATSGSGVRMERIYTRLMGTVLLGIGPYAGAPGISDTRQQDLMCLT